MADKTTISERAGGLTVAKEADKGVHTSWTFATDADAAKQRAEFDAHLTGAQRAKLDAVAVADVGK